MQMKISGKWKMRSFVVCMLLVALLIGSVGCAQTKEVEQDATQKKNMLFHGFESVDELYSFDATNRFGRVTYNEDTAYVTEGKHSAKLEVYGDFKKGTANPCLHLMADTGNDYAYPDFSCVKAITFDLYNDSQQERKIEVSLTFAGGTVTNYQEYALSQGWNSITYEVDGSQLAVSNDIKKTSMMNITFEKCPNRETKPFVFYMDNVEFSLREIEWEAVELVQKENELCNFDDNTKASLVYSSCIGAGASYAPVLSLNQDLAYCKNYEGTSLKVLMPAGQKVNNSWPNFTFNSVLFEKYNLTEMALEGKELVFDIYNTGSSYNLSVEANSVHNDSTVAYVGTPITAEPGWNEIRYPISTLYDCIGYLEGEEVRMSDPGVMTEFRISWCEFVGDDKIMYFDNFRFE